MHLFMDVFPHKSHVSERGMVFYNNSHTVGALGEEILFLTEDKCNIHTKRWNK